MIEHRESTFTKEQRDELKAIVHEAMTDYFLQKGKSGKALIVGAAIIIGSIAVIFGGLKSLLGWLGFVIMRG